MVEELQTVSWPPGRRKYPNQEFWAMLLPLA